MPADLGLLRQLDGDDALYARTCLKIRDKAGKIVPFVFNPAQVLVNDLLNAQLREKGWVRALILKARQPGISTLVASRFYKRSSMRPGLNTYILAHEQGSSNNLFSIVDRFQRYNPIAPHVGVSNTKELEFDLLESSYAVATAGQKAGGRGRSTSLYHGSECAFWPNARDHFASSVQGVPLMPGTEVILESTANGPTGEFYERCQDAERGVGDYMLIFIPWHMTAEYSRPLEPGFSLQREADDGQLSEIEIAEMFGLTLEQMLWRRYKLTELRSIDELKQEYPADASEAFTKTDSTPFIEASLVLRARHRKPKAGAGPLIFGVDPASMGGDRFAICARRGMVVEWVKFRTKVEPVEGAAWIRSLIDEHNPARVCVDAGNIGYAIISMLRSDQNRHYNEIVRSVNFGGTSEHKLAKPKVPGPGNRRAEMWDRIREWLLLPDGAVLPNIPELQSDLTAPQRKSKLNNDFLLESKEELKKRGVRSPDFGDALGLTFAIREVIDKYHEPAKAQNYGDLTAPAPKLVTEYLGPMGWMA